MLASAMDYLLRKSSQAIDRMTGFHTDGLCRRKPCPDGRNRLPGGSSGSAVHPALRRGTRRAYCAVTRHTASPTSSAMSSAPCLSCARPTGAPYSDFSSSEWKPLTTT